MKAIILAAGEGVRMRPLTDTRPKVMLPLANRPILEHLVGEAVQAGIREFVFVTGYHSQTIEEHFGRGERWGAKIGYVIQRKQQGTAHALSQVPGLGGELLLMNGDVIVRASDIARIAAAPGLVMAVTERENTLHLGVVEVDGDRVTGIFEKVAHPPSHLVNAGVYRLGPEIEPALARTPKSPRGEYEITDTLQMLVEQGNPIHIHRLGYWLDLSYPWDLLEANKSLMQDIKGDNQGVVEEGAIIRGPVIIGKGSRVRSGSYIEGPVILGEGCDIGPNCYIRPATAIGNGCHIGSGVEVKNSIVMSGSKIPHHSYVGDSIIGQDCNLGAGTQIANLRLDKTEIEVGGVPTRRRKLGAILGDGVQTGVNACINVGSLIGSHSHIGPGARVKGVVSPHSRIL